MHNLATLWHIFQPNVVLLLILLNMKLSHELIVMKKLALKSSDKRVQTHLFISTGGHIENDIPDYKICLLSN